MCNEAGSQRCTHLGEAEHGDSDIERLESTAIGTSGTAGSRTSSLLTTDAASHYHLSDGDNPSSLHLLAMENTEPLTGRRDMGQSTHMNDSHENIIRDEEDIILDQGFKVPKENIKDAVEALASSIRELGLSLANNALAGPLPELEFTNVEQPIHGNRSPFRISALPVEIITEIFAFACHTNNPMFHVDPNRKLKITPFILSSICKEWRVLVHSTPFIWSYVYLCLALSRYDTQISLFKNWIERSGTCLLTIHFIFEDEADWSDRLPIEFIQPFISTCTRWRAVDIVLPESWYPILDEIKFTENIQNLHTAVLQPLWTDCHLSPAKRKRLTLFNSAPSIREVHLNGYYIEDVDIPWEQLHLLTLQHVFLYECFYALFRCPNINHCKIFTILESGDRIFEVPSIRLHNLHEVLVYHATWKDTSRLLASLDAPNLQTLEFSWPEDKHFPYLPRLLRRLGCSNTLTKLRLTDFLYVNENESELATFIRGIPTLRNLKLEMRASSRPFSVFFPNLLLAYDAIYENDIGAETRLYYLPNLERFSYSGPIKIDGALGESIMQILRLRDGSGKPAPTERLGNRPTQLARLSSFRINTDLTVYEDILPKSQLERLNALSLSGTSTPRLIITFDPIS